MHFGKFTLSGCEEPWPGSKGVGPGDSQNLTVKIEVWKLFSVEGSQERGLQLRVTIVTPQSLGWEHKVRPFCPKGGGRAVVWHKLKVFGQVQRRS